MNGATWAGVGAIGLWAFLALLNRAAAGLPPLQLTAMAFAVSAACGIGSLAASGRSGELRQSWAAWLHGVGGLFGYHTLYFAALASARNDAPPPSSSAHPARASAVPTACRRVNRSPSSAAESSTIRSGHT